MQKVLALVKTAVKDWSDDNAPRLGAALAYYTVFSMAPLLLIAITIAGAIFGAEAARGQIVREIGAVIGESGGEMIQEMVASAHRDGSGVFASAIGILTLLLGASGVFGELRSALDIIWDVEMPKANGIVGMARQRIASFAMVLVIGFLLLVSLVLSAALSAVGKFLGDIGPIVQALNFVASLVVITLLFAMIFKLVPDTQIAWGDVWAGACMTAVLFTIGKFLIGLYLAHSSTASSYGAAGSLVVILAWVYYAAQIMFLGAELTQAYARRHGSRAGEDRVVRRDQA